jgi:hypothetical protein
MERVSGANTGKAFPQGLQLELRDGFCQESESQEMRDEQLARAERASGEASVEAGSVVRCLIDVSFFEFF